MSQPFRFATFDIDHFLSHYWQKKPLLIPNPWAAWRNPLEPDELAGLAIEPDVESRLIEQGSPLPSARWSVENGPIPENRFSNLGAHPWTLLVQAVDHYVPEVAALIEPFRFIPDWRIDDIMVSYASDGGGVGAHFDQYDVFLIQGLGQRRWQVGPKCSDHSPLIPHDSLRLLAQFEATDEWVLEPGDILYIPPGFAHNGVAVGDDCMTYSVGFRAPSRAELIGYFVDDILDTLDEDDRYTDPDLRAVADPAEITPQAIDRLHAMIVDKVGDRAAFTRWLGKYLTEPKYPDREPEAVDVEALRAAIAEGAPLPKEASNRVSFVRGEDGKVTLFVDGEIVAL